MTWKCPICNEELGELNGYCVYCKVRDGSIVYNPDKYYIREIRTYHIGVKVMDYKDMSETEVMAEIDSNVNMNPQEKLYAKLFWHETVKVVKDMDRLTLRAHIEELAKISFEGRVRLDAAKNEDDRRGKVSKKEVTGFAPSLNVDETSTNAINIVKERQERMTKAQRIRKDMIDMYVKSGQTKEQATALADSVMSAGTLLIQTKRAAADAKAKAEENKPEIKLAVSPFAKKENI